MFDFLDAQPTLETDEMPEDPMIIRRRPNRRRVLSALRKEKLEAFLTELPGPGETWHIVSNGKFDYWHFVPVVLGLVGEDCLEWYGSTWTMSRPNALELLELFDAGKLKRVVLFSGTYFKRREAVYTTISGGLIDRNQTMLCFENHTKIMAMRFPSVCVVIEGSANFTANPRVEQNTITNDAALFEFHKGWMDEMVAKSCKQ